MTEVRPDCLYRSLCAAMMSSSDCCEGCPDFHDILPHHLHERGIRLLYQERQRKEKKEFSETLRLVRAVKREMLGLDSEPLEMVRKRYNARLKELCRQASDSTQRYTRIYFNTSVPGDRRAKLLQDEDARGRALRDERERVETEIEWLDERGIARRPREPVRRHPNDTEDERRERKNRYMREWFAANPDRARAIKNKYLRKKRRAEKKRVNNHNYYVKHRDEIIRKATARQRAEKSGATS